MQDKSAFMVEEDQDEGDGKNGYVGERGSRKYGIRGQPGGQEVAGRKTSRRRILWACGTSSHKNPVSGWLVQKRLWGERGSARGGKVLEVILILTKLYDFHIGSVTESTLWRSRLRQHLKVSPSQYVHFNECPDLRQQERLGQDQKKLQSFVVIAVRTDAAPSTPSTTSTTSTPGLHHIQSPVPVLIPSPALQKPPPSPFLKTSDFKGAGFAQSSRAHKYVLSLQQQGVGVGSQRGGEGGGGGYGSTDYGSTYERMNDRVGTKTVLSYLYVCPTNKRKTENEAVYDDDVLQFISLTFQGGAKIMVLTDPEFESSLLISSDEGASYQKYRLTFYVLSLLFHHTEEDWALAYSHDQKHTSEHTDEDAVFAAGPISLQTHRLSTEKLLKK
ncbi:VPS10 domain-containing receptor SorCS1 [Liparis tanakae]|uniref:VPS10 domain-containing receptor SorCS1 n=1 Tax=Liparis tanakae TaxID=230148 RepID=A0A4Z2IJ63_9TELE|nr:VPS10 domain-containing receptor SorCS1 [Liparis tanakae]